MGSVTRNQACEPEAEALWAEEDDQTRDEHLIEIERAMGCECCPHAWHISPCTTEGCVVPPWLTFRRRSLRG